MLAVVFAELVLFIEETRQDEKTTPVFGMADLVLLYESRMELFSWLILVVHTLSLKNRYIQDGVQDGSQLSVETVCDMERVFQTHYFS